MNLTHDVSDIVKRIGEILRISIEEKENEYLFTFHDKPFVLLKTTLLEIIETLAKQKVENNTSLFFTNGYEILINEESDFVFSRREYEKPLEDNSRKISYEIGKPSNEYLIFLIDLFIENKDLRLRFRKYPETMMKSRLENCLDVFDLLRVFVFSIDTLRIKSEDKRTHTEFEKLSDSFVFQLSYNFDVAVVCQHNFDSILRSSRIYRVRNSNIESISLPKRTYVPDLVYHYQLAISTGNPFLQYISFYHIIEHFFEDIANESLNEIVKNKITHPSFSHNSKADIKSLIKEITKATKIRDESMAIKHEQVALELCLEKFINLSELIADLEKFETNLIEYYKNNKVSFSDGSFVDLKSVNISSIYKQLSQRIYFTRNAIVHSKDSDKSKYTPFRDDSILHREVPLLRFICEQVIIFTSKII